MANALRKDQPSVDDVHAAANGVGTRDAPKRRREFRTIVAETTQHRADVGKVYGSVDELPKPVKDKFKEQPKKLRQFRDVFNSAHAQHGDEKKAFAEAWAAVEKVEWSIDVPLAKTDEAQNLVFGWASIVEKDGKPVVDSEGDIITEADLEKAIYDFAQHAGVAGEMHREFGDQIGKLVECMVFTKAKQQMLGVDLGKVGAWVGFRVSPDIFAKVKDGTYKSFSIGGIGRRKAMEAA